MKETIQKSVENCYFVSAKEEQDYLDKVKGLQTMLEALVSGMKKQDEPRDTKNESSRQKAVKNNSINTL